MSQKFTDEQYETWTKENLTLAGLEIIHVTFNPTYAGMPLETDGKMMVVTDKFPYLFKDWEDAFNFSTGYLMATEIWKRCCSHA